MGCEFSQEQNKNSIVKPRKMKMCNKVGQLTVKINDFFLREIQEKTEKLKNLFLKIRLGVDEQYLLLTDIKNRNSNSVQFPINSSLKPYGRFLLIQLWNDVVREDKYPGFGIIILDPLLLASHSRKIRCDLNYKNSPAGSLETEICFQQYPFEIVSFKLFSMVLRVQQTKKTNISAKIIMGEEILEAQVQKQSETDRIPFKNEVFHFQIPSYLKQGEIKIVQKKGNSDIFLGKVRINLLEIIEKEEQHDEVEILYHDEIVKGKVQFSTLKGIKTNEHFSTPSLLAQNFSYLNSLKGFDDGIDTQPNTKSSKDNGTQLYSSNKLMGSLTNFEVEKIITKNRQKLRKRLSCQIEN